MRLALVFAHPSGGLPLMGLARVSRQISPAEPDQLKCVHSNQQPGAFPPDRVRILTNGGEGGSAPFRVQGSALRTTPKARPHGSRAGPQKAVETVPVMVKRGSTMKELP